MWKQDKSPEHFQSQYFKQISNTDKKMAFEHTRIYLFSVVVENLFVYISLSCVNLEHDLQIGSGAEKRLP